MTLFPTAMSLRDLAESQSPIDEHLTRGTQLRHNTQRTEWTGGEVVLSATADTVTVAPYKKDTLEWSGMKIDYTLQVTIDRHKPADREKLANYEIIGYDEVP